MTILDLAYWLHQSGCCLNVRHDIIYQVFTARIENIFDDIDGTQVAEWPRGFGIGDTLEEAIEEAKQDYRKQRSEFIKDEK